MHRGFNTLNKTNWANKIDKAPFYAYGVTCGITFTFGGLRVNQKCQVLNKVMKPCLLYTSPSPRDVP